MSLAAMLDTVRAQFSRSVPTVADRGEPAPADVLDKLTRLDKAAAVSYLKTDFSAFCEAFSRAESQFDDVPELRELTFAPEIETKISQAVQDMRSQGFAVWPNFISDRQKLEALRQICVRIRERSDALDVRGGDITDPESGWYYQGQSCGRSRALFPHPADAEAIPAEMSELLHDPVLKEVIVRTFKASTKSKMLVAESVVPTSEYERQWWHIDRIMDQAKIMLLFNEVSDRTGPMKIVPNTHKFEGPNRMIHFNYFREGVDFSDVPIGLINKDRSLVKSVTGNPGDCIFFNTAMYHAIGRADEGERLTGTIYYGNLGTPKNNFINAFHPGHWI